MKNVKHKSNNRLFVFFLLTGLSVTTTTVFGQEENMLIGQIAGREITRLSFDENENLVDKQIFRIGQIQYNDNDLSVKVITEFYDEKDSLESKYVTTYRCNPEQADLMLLIFPWANRNSDKLAIEIKSDDFKSLYDFSTGGQLQDTHIKMTIESGALSFFGSKSTIELTDREVSLDRDVFKVQGKITIKAYLMGIKIKTIEYEIEELFGRNRLLKKQTFSKNDGSYFVLDY